MCKRKSDAVIPKNPTLPPFPQVSPAPRSCEVGWKPWGTSCYGIISGAKRTWEDARADCHRRFAELLVINDQREQDYFTSILKPYDDGFWIGLTDSQLEGKYVWVSEVAATLTNWLPREPNNGFGNEDCVAMRGGRQFSGGWNDNNCQAVNSYICEKNSGVHNCPRGWITYGDYCYQLNAHPVQMFTWEAAHNACLAFNHRFIHDLKLNLAEAELVSILSADEHRMIYQELNNIHASVFATYYWIGLQPYKDTWIWSDRSLYKYQNWQDNATAIAQPVCVKASLSSIHGGWETAPCTEKHVFICKVKRGKDRCYDPLGMQNYNIPDTAITSNSQFTFSTPAIASRLHKLAGNTLDGAWCVAKGAHARRPYLQVDFGHLSKLTYLGVQGKANAVSIVTQFVMMFSNDGQTWDPYWKYSVRFKIQPSFYLNRRANYEQVVHFKLKYPLTTRYVRIYPYACHQDCCMRIEFYGCEHEEDSVKCGRGWREDAKSGHCYRFSEEASTWDDATTYCINHGGNLLSIMSEQENNFLKKELSPLSGKTYDYWTGLNDLAKIGLFRWEDKSPLVYINWDTDNPIKGATQPYRIDYRSCLKECGNKGGLCTSFCGKNGYCCQRGWVDCPQELSRASGSASSHVCVRAAGTIHKQCVSIQSKTGKWRSKSCDTERRFICKRDYNVAKKVRLPFSTNWRTNATFYWPLDKVVREHVLGTLSGSAKGAFPPDQIDVPSPHYRRRDALRFDGITNFLELPLTPKTAPCATNPDSSSCVHGFTMSFLFRYDEPDSVNAAPIVDNMGDLNTATLGYKVQIKQGSIIVTLRGHERGYTAYTAFNKTVWNHFAFTWAPLKGLSLYINGNNTVSDLGGIANEKYLTQDVTKDIFVAKSASHFVFAKIKMASLALFERALSTAEIRDIYIAELGHCKPEQMAHGSFCYELDTSVIRSSAATTNCKNKGGKLITIHSPIEQAWFSYTLRKFNLTDGVFIGLKSKKNQHATWDDGTPLVYSYWGKYMPKWRRYYSYYYSVYQVFAMSNGHWATPVNSYKRKPYICKFSKTIQSGTTQRKKTFNIQLRPGSRQTFGCSVMNDLKIVSATLGRKLGNCWLDSSIALQIAASFCKGPRCVDVKIAHENNPCKKTYYSPIFNITYECNPVPSTSLNQGCKDDYSKYMDHACYKLYLEKMTIDKAREQCKKDGAELTSITSSEEETFLASMMVQLYKRDDVWIGIKYDATTQKYSWMNGQPVLYTNWYNGYPDPRVGKFGKVSADHHGADRLLFWNAANKTEAHPFFCRMLKLDATEPPMKTRETPKGICPKDWSRYGSYCYFVLKTALGHVDASSECSRLAAGADLVSISTTAENKFVFELLQNQSLFFRAFYYNAWIGLTNEDMVRGYHWRDGSPLKFINWYTNDPNTGNRHLCVGMNRAGKWWDLPCYSKYKSVCKVRVADKLPTTRPPSLSTKSPIDDDTYPPPYCTFTLGDGVGGTETREKNMPRVECIKRCLTLKKENPSVNGVTIDTRGNDECYCEINRNSWNKVDRYQSCEFQYSKPTEDKLLHIKSETTLTRGQVLTTANKLLKVYSVSFELKPTAFAGEEVSYSSVFHITTGDNTGSMGVRIPALWIRPEGKIYICTGVNTDSNTCYSGNKETSVKLNTWANVTMRQALVGNSYQFQVFLDGNQIYSKTNYKPREYRDVLIYAGDPWYPVQAGKIRNVIISGTCCSRIEKGSEIFFHPNELAIKKNQSLLPRLKSLKKEYVISFEIKPRSFDSKADIISIMYLSSGSTIKEFAPGAPWIYIPKRRKKRSVGAPPRPINRLCMLIHRKKMKCVDAYIPLGQWTKVQISQLRFASNYIYQLSINDSKIFDVWNETPKTFFNLSVYFSDPFHVPLDGSVRNVTIKDLLFCEPGWRTVNNSCYYFSKTKGDFQEARKMCRNMTSHLVAISNGNENKMLAEQSNLVFSRKPEDTVYIGLSDRSNEGGWEWESKTPVSYINWGESQPDDALGGEDCVSLESDGKWNDIPCNHKSHYICEKSEDPNFGKKEEAVPDSDVGYCDDNWVQHGSKCYLFKLNVKDRRNFLQALEYCKNIDGDLVSIHSVHENAFILSQLKTSGHQIWIGLTDQRTEGSFLWTDQSSVDYTHWNSYEPNNQGNEDCAELISNFQRRGVWNDITCKAKLKFVCQKKSNTKGVKPTKSTEEKLVCTDDYKRYKDNCYKMVSTPMTWPDANSECKKIPRGNLVSIHELYVQAFLFSQSAVTNSSSWWIGLHKPPTARELVWSDNTPVNYEFWKNSQKPYVSDNSTACISEENDKKFKGLWTAHDCSAKLPFMCQISNTPLIKSPGFLGNCSKGWVKLGGKCYKYFKDNRKRWGEAQRICEFEGGNLATVDSMEVQSLISNMIQFQLTKAWIGLNDRENEHVFKWVSQAPYDPKKFSYWHHQEPNDNVGKENCVMMWTQHGQWNDASCGNYYNYVCEHPLECRDPLGMENGDIPDSAITATSFRGSNYPENARLNFKNNQSASDAWCANSTADEHPVLTIDLGNLMTITRIVTQGLSSDHVISYNLDYSEDGKKWIPYTEDNVRRVMPGSGRYGAKNGQTVNIRAVHLRFKPLIYKEDACLRLEFYGCKAICSRPLGMASNAITNAQLAASSNAMAVGKARPSYGAGWCSASGDQKPWYKIELDHVMKLTRVMATSDNIEMLYILLFGNRSEEAMKKYKGYDGEIRAFPMQPSVHDLEYPQLAKFVKFEVTNWEKQACLQVELYGCEFDCDIPLGMESKLIDDSAITASSQQPDHPSYYGRLNDKAWCTTVNDDWQYLRIELPTMTKVTYIATQGLGGSYVKLYNLQWSRDGELYHQILLQGNSNGDDIMKVKLKEPLTARFIHIVPIREDVVSSLCMRVELYGCPVTAIYPGQMKRQKSKAGLKSQHAGLSNGSKIGIVIFFLLLLVAIFVVGFIYYKRTRKGYAKANVTKVKLEEDRVQIIDNDDDDGATFDDEEYKDGL